MKITGVFKDALTRQADEAVRIHAKKNNELLNSKPKFNHPTVARVIIEKNIREYFKQDDVDGHITRLYSSEQVN